LISQLKEYKLETENGYVTNVITFDKIKERMYKMNTMKPDNCFIFKNNDIEDEDRKEILIRFLLIFIESEIRIYFNGKSSADEKLVCKFKIYDDFDMLPVQNNEGEYVFYADSWEVIDKMIEKINLTIFERLIDGGVPFYDIGLW